MPIDKKQPLNIKKNGINNVNTDKSGKDLGAKRQNIGNKGHYSQHYIQKTFLY
jgi:hypothetical protein